MQTLPPLLSTQLGHCGRGREGGREGEGEGGREGGRESGDSFVCATLIKNSFCIQQGVNSMALLWLLLL